MFTLAGPVLTSTRPAHPFTKRNVSYYNAVTMTVKHARMTTEAHLRSPGRPRSPHIHQAIIEAAQDLVDRVGFERLTIEAIAAQAGVSKTSIYRRWPNKTAILMDLMLETVKTLPTTLNGTSFRRVIKQRIQVLTRACRGPLGKAMAGLIAGAHADPELERIFSHGFVRQRRREVRGLIEEGKSGGQLAHGLDADLFMDVLFGAVFYRLLISREPVTERYIDALIEHAIHVTTSTTGKHARTPAG